MVIMRKTISKIDKIIILCRNVDKSSALYSETLGLRVYLQSPELVQLRDTSNIPIYLQQSRNPSQLSKGYSPILSFNVTSILSRSLILIKSEANSCGMTSLKTEICLRVHMEKQQLFWELMAKQFLLMIFQWKKQKRKRQKQRVHRVRR